MIIISITLRNFRRKKGDGQPPYQRHSMRRMNEVANLLQSRIMIVEDDPGICNFLKTTLEAEGYRTETVQSGKAALALISSQCPDVILLDLGLPDMDGMEIIESVRSWTRTPLIVLSARSMEEDKAKALDSGADDYLTKPFGTVELLARIRAALRHTRTSAADETLARTEVFTTGGLTIDYRSHRVTVDGREIHLTRNEYKIVAILGLHAGQVVTYKTLIRELWGPSASTDNKILRVHAASIRRKLEDNPNEPKYIFTEIGVGYRLEGE